MYRDIADSPPGSINIDELQIFEVRDLGTIVVTDGNVVLNSVAVAGTEASDTSWASGVGMRSQAETHLAILPGFPLVRLSYRSNFVSNTDT